MVASASAPPPGGPRARMRWRLFGVLCLLVAGAGLWAVLIARSHAQPQPLEDARVVIAVERLAASFERRTSSARGYLLSGAASELASARAAAAEVAAAMREAERLLPLTEPLDEIAAVLADHGAALDRVLALRVEAGPAAAHAAWLAEVLPRARRARTDVDALRVRIEDAHLRAEAAGSEARARLATLLVAVGLGVLVLAAIGAAAYVRANRVRVHDAERNRRFLQQLLDALPIGVIAAEAPSGRVLHASGLAAPLARDAAGTRALPLGRALDGETVVQEELVLDDGTHVAATAAPVRDDDGAIIAAVVAFADISERKHGERERELFLGALGHDLRGPLAAIQLGAETLRDQAMPRMAQTAAERIGRSADRMLRLIQQLLDFTRSQHGVIPIAPVPCDLGDVARDVVAGLEPGCADCRIELRRDGETHSVCDPDRIAQVLQNLLGNAMEHGDRTRPIEVVVGTRGDRARLEVTNHGPTIPPASVPSLFEPFRQGRRSKGLGLGLYIAQAVVQAHGGAIEVESADGRTTFRVLFPRRPAAPAAA